MDHYKARESTRQQGKVVYDVDKDSPFYKNAKDFIDPKQQIRIDETTAMVSKKHGARPTKNRYFKELKPWYKAEAAYDSTLVFESRFERGGAAFDAGLNLRRFLVRIHNANEADRDNGHGWALPWHELRHAGNMAILDNGMRHELHKRVR